MLRASLNKTFPSFLWCEPARNVWAMVDRSDEVVVAPTASKLFSSGRPAQRELCMKQQAQPELNKEVTWVPIPADWTLRPKMALPKMSSHHRRWRVSNVGPVSQKVPRRSLHSWLHRHMVMDHSDAREETRCPHKGYSFRLAGRVLLYAASQRQDSTYQGLCYTSC